MASSKVQVGAAVLLVIFAGAFSQKSAGDKPAEAAKPLGDAKLQSSSSQRAVLYDQINSQGGYVVLPETYIEDLAQANFDNRARSVCVTGIWLFYQDRNYNGAGSRAMEYVFGRNNYCVNFLTIGGTVSSARYAGVTQNYGADSFNLYQYDYFQGAEEYILDQAANLNLAQNHQSIIITGNQDWTIFDRPYFQGNSVCLLVPEPGNSTPAFIANIENIPGQVQKIPYGSIKSVRKGCFSKANNVTLQSFSDGRNAIIEPRSLE